MQWRVKNATPKVDVNTEIKKKILSPPAQTKLRLTRAQKGKWVPKAPTIPATTKKEAEVICSSSLETVDATVTQLTNTEIFALIQAKFMGISSFFK